MNHKRGTILEEKDTRTSRNLGKLKGLTLAGQTLDPADETKHCKMIGTTGTGKSAAIRELLLGALERGDRAVIADPDGIYLARFYDPHRGDVILNPFDSRAARWDLFAEMQTTYDADQLARSLIPDADGPEKNWCGYARIFLSSLLRQLHRVKHNDVAELYQLLTTTPVCANCSKTPLRDPISRRTTANSSVPSVRSPTRISPRSSTSPSNRAAINSPSATGLGEKVASAMKGSGEGFYTYRTRPTKSPRCVASSAPGCASLSSKR